MEKHIEFTSENCPAKNLSLIDMEGEEWINIVDYEGSYSISNYGRIRSNQRTDPMGRMIRERILIQGYRRFKNNYANEGYSVVLCKNGSRKAFDVSKLVGLTFCGDRGENEVYVHLNKKLFDNRSSNIKILTNKESKRLDFDLGAISHENIALGHTNYNYLRIYDSKLFNYRELVDTFSKLSAVAHTKAQILRIYYYKGFHWLKVPLNKLTDPAIYEIVNLHQSINKLENDLSEKIKELDSKQLIIRNSWRNKKTNE